MTARLTVLGCAGTHPGPERVCSSYLVEADGARLLMDCGNGSLANLQKRCDVAEVDAVLISHLHPDHFADLYGLYYALRFHPDGPQSLPVYAPTGAQVFVGQLLPGDELFGAHLEFHSAAAGQRLGIGPFDLELFAADHSVETLAPRVRLNGKVLAYSADSGATPTLVDCAGGADVFVCDSSWLERGGPYPTGVHMTGAQAGELAAHAGAATLVVTHVYPSNDPAEVAAEAAASFDGRVVVAEDLLEVPL